MNILELSQDFIKNYMELRLKPTTIQGYLRNIQAHILPLLSCIELNELDCDILDRLVTQLSSSGLSNTSIVYVLSTLSKMYSYAVKRKYTSYNPLFSYDYPKKDSYYYQTLDEDQINKLVEACRGSDIFPAVLFAAHYGLRRGEACAVLECDLTGNVLNVRRTVSCIGGREVITTPKNNKIRLVKLLPSDVEALKEYSQSRKPNSEGRLMRGLNGDTLIPNLVYKRYKRFLRELGLPKVRFHDLRHSYATMMMRNGVNPKIVSSVLGHSSVKVTLDTYSHCTVDMQDACLEVFRKAKM
ncbi:MAG: site-specific integrase [Clostridia bacterium]|nr:site-specific integrase [Clostridia bacterium]